jgi:hypothetical protein
MTILSGQCGGKMENQADNQGMMGQGKNTVEGELTRRAHALLQRLAQARPGDIAGFLLVLVAAMGGAALAKGGFYIGKHEGDTLQLADIVLRIARGEWPHLDFMTPIGYLAMAPIALFVKLGAGIGHAIFYAQIMVALLLLPATVYVATSRFSGLSRWLYASFIMVLCLALVHGETEVSLSISMHYNRWAWAIAYLAVPLAVMAPPRDRPLAEGLILGLGVAALVLIKTTYVIALAPGLMVALIARRRWGVIGVASVAGLMVAAVMTLAAGSDFWGAYLHDLEVVARSPIRPQPGQSFFSVAAAPAFILGTMALLAVVVFLRQSARMTEGLALMLLMPGLIYIVFQNYGNDPQWLLLVALMAFALRPGPGLRNPLGWDLRQGLGLAGVVLLTLGAGSALNLAYSPLRHLAAPVKNTRPLIAGMAQHHDILAQKARVYAVNNSVAGDLPGSGYEAYAADAERSDKDKAVLLGETLPVCEQQTGMSALFDAAVKDLDAAGFGGKRILAADLFSLFWLFGDYPPVKGAAPWYYGGLPGIENADYIFVPICPISKNVRATMLKALAESKRQITVVRRTPVYILIEAKVP